jgi:cation/acetate symporter
MLLGFSVCVYYMMRTHPALGGSPVAQWFGIASNSAGVFGVPAGFAAIYIVSMLTAPPDTRTTAFIHHIRTP